MGLGAGDESDCWGGGGLTEKDYAPNPSIYCSGRKTVTAGKKPPASLATMRKRRLVPFHPNTAFDQSEYVL